MKKDTTATIQHFDIMKKKTRFLVIIISFLMLIFCISFPFFFWERGQEFMQNHFPTTKQALKAIVMGFCFSGAITSFIAFFFNICSYISDYNHKN